MCSWTTLEAENKKGICRVRVIIKGVLCIYFALESLNDPANRNWQYLCFVAHKIAQTVREIVILQPFHNIANT